jgi:AcrR family transcriptional regulator
VTPSPSSDLTSRLIDEAARILTEVGPAGLSLRKLASACGVSTMPVYTLFGDKQGLLTAMHREGFQRLGQQLQAVQQSDDALGDLVALGLAYRKAALTSSHLYGLMFGQAAEFRPDAAAREAADATYQPLVAAVTRCQQAGPLRRDFDSRRIALHLWSVTHGMVLLEMNGQLPGADASECLFQEALQFAVAPFIA